MEADAYIDITAYNASPLLWVAEQARDCIAPDIGDLDPGQRAAWIAAVFAHSAVEAFGNDLGNYASKRSDEDRSGRLALVGQMLGILENQHASIVAKLEIAYLTLSGSGWDRSGSVWADFKALSDLRHAIIHGKPDDSLGRSLTGTEATVTVKVVPLRRALESRCLLPSSNGLLTEMAANRRTAEWACWTARDTIGALWKVIPNGPREVLSDLFNGMMNGPDKPPPPGLPEPAT